MYRMRLWSVSKSRLMEACYDRFEHALVKVAPILGAFGFERFERPVAALEKVLIQEVREIKGVNGVHVMAYRQEEAVAEIIDASGVLESRTAWRPDNSIRSVS